MDAKRQQILVIPLDMDGPGDYSLEEFTGMWEAAVLKIPEQWRDKAIVELDGGYDSRPTFRLRFSRDETDAEMTERLNRQAKMMRNRDMADRETYRRLKQRFEP